MPKKGEKCTEKQLAALRKNQKRLKKGEARTREIGAAGGKKSGEVRREAAERKTFAQHLAEELDILNKNGEPVKREVAKKFIETVKKASPKTAAKLFEVLRDTLGEAPAQKIDINANVKTVGNWREALKDSAGLDGSTSAESCSHVITTEGDITEETSGTASGTDPYSEKIKYTNGNAADTFGNS